MATKIYSSGASIVTENVFGQGLKHTINAGHFDWQKVGDIYKVRDGIENQSYELGEIGDIEDESGTAYADIAAMETALNGFVNVVSSSASSSGTSVTNPDYSRYTSPEVLVTEQDLTASYADFGAEIDVRGYTFIALFIVADVNDSEDVDLKILGKHESAGADEYEIDGVSVKTLWSGSGTDFKKVYEFNTGSIPYIQVQAIADTAGATAGDLTIIINKKYNSN